MANNNKLNNQYCINVDDETRAQIEILAQFYQRKPAELLRLLIMPAIINQYAQIQRQAHPENQSAPQLAIFKQ